MISFANLWATRNVFLCAIEKHVGSNVVSFAFYFELIPLGQQGSICQLRETKKIVSKLHL